MTPAGEGRLPGIVYGWGTAWPVNYVEIFEKLVFQGKKLIDKLVSKPYNWPEKILDSSATLFRKMEPLIMVL